MCLKLILSACRGNLPPQITHNGVITSIRKRTELNVSGAKMIRNTLFFLLVFDKSTEANKKKYRFASALGNEMVSIGVLERDKNGEMSCMALISWLFH